MTLEDKTETLTDFGYCIQEAKRYFDNGNDYFCVVSGNWKIEYDRTDKKEELEK